MRKILKGYLSYGKFIEIIELSLTDSLQRGIWFAACKFIILEFPNLDAFWSHLSIYETTHILRKNLCY